MADVLCDLVVHPDAHGLPPVTIALTLVATLETMLGGAEPGQVDGHLVPAEMVRELAYTFGLLPRPEPQFDDLTAEPPPHDLRAGTDGEASAGTEESDRHSDPPAEASGRASSTLTDRLDG